MKPEASLPRAIYEDALQVRMEAATLRTQRFITRTQPVRANARPPHGLPLSS